jgi:hypothetical protein
MTSRCDNNAWSFSLGLLPDGRQVNSEAETLKSEIGVGSEAHPNI